MLSTYSPAPFLPVSLLGSLSDSQYLSSTTYQRRRFPAYIPVFRFMMPSPTLKWPKLAKNPLPMVPLPHAFQQLLKMGGNWESGLCNCTPLSSCILGSFLPCFHTSSCHSVWESLKIKAVINTCQKKNPCSCWTNLEPLTPSDIIEPTMLNVDCLVHVILTCGGLGWMCVSPLPPLNPQSP